MWSLQALMAALLVSLVAAIAASSAAAAGLTEADELTRFGSFGTAAGQLEYNPTIATDPVTGDVLVGGSGNSRVAEFTPWGGFVKAFGWDVAPGSVNEQQEVRLRAGAGDFRLGFEGDQTGDLPFDATGEEVQAGLDGLPSVAGPGGNVEVEERPGNAATQTPYVYVVTFKGSLAGTNVPQLAVENGSVPLSGGNPSTESEVRTRADGTAGGTGLESCTAESGCQAGDGGSGVGEITAARKVAVDAKGAIFVGEFANDRIQEFSPAGRFVAMLGEQVDKTEVKKREQQEAKAEPVTVTEVEEDRCTAASGDECGAGVEGAGPYAYAYHTGANEGPIAFDPATNDLLVGNGERIARFDEEGNLISVINVTGGVVYALAVDPLTGMLYVTLQSSTPTVQATKNNVRELDPSSGAEVGAVNVETPTVLAFGSEGQLYLIREENKSGREIPEAVLEFSASGELESTVMLPGEVQSKPLDEVGIAVGPAGDVYVAGYFSNAQSSVSGVRAFGPAPVELEAPPLAAPTIVAQYALAVEAEGAEMGAEINPHFWSDTTFYVEYGTQPCSEGGCARQPVAAESQLSHRVSGTALPATQELTGLQPATEYHYRFVADSSGGGPVVGPEGGGEGTFRTAGLPETGLGCPNESLRSGFAALLPDCRAYEMVTPLDKGNGDITVLKTTSGDLPAVLQESAVSGERLAYGSYRAFGDAQSAPYTTQYVAQRSASGWSSHAISPPRTNIVVSAAKATDTEFREFSPDLCQSWLVTLSNPPLAPGAAEGEENLYRRDDGICGGETDYKALATVQPGAKQESRELELQGVADEGADVIYVSNAEVPGLGSGGVHHEVHLYEASPTGEPLMLCVLPSGEQVSGPCTAGGGIEGGADTDGRRMSLQHAISSNGSRVFWTASRGRPGKIYLRENPLATGEECVYARSACTIAVSKQAEVDSKSSGSEFRLASEDGSRAVFTTEGGSGSEDLYEFAVDGETTRLIAHKVAGLLGASEGATRIYLVSSEVLTGEANSEGSFAVEGKPNLYLYRAGGGEGSSSPPAASAFTFIGTFSKADVEFLENDVTVLPAYHLARVSPDGLHVAFVSAARLTGYDNTDQANGEADSEVYLYDASPEAGQGQLLCASCEPGGARPVGRRILGSNGYQTFAATIPSWENSLYASRALAKDGSRLFFDSFDALDTRDTNGQEDVYEWEMPGVGSCSERSGTYSPVNGGCVNLISSGQSTRDSQFVDASPSGDDVFFATLSSLVPQDPGLVDIYDARVDGGFPASQAEVTCEGEACQAPANPPAFKTPGSLQFEGRGNLASTRPHAKRKGKAKHPATRQARKRRAARTCRHEHRAKRRRACETRLRKQVRTRARTKARGKGVGRQGARLRASGRGVGRHEGTSGRDGR